MGILENQPAQNVEKACINISGRVFFKNGAEGVFLALIPEHKSALAVKIVDGAARAAEVAIAGLITDLKIINENQLKNIKEKKVTNSTNQVIGYMKWIL